MNKMRKKKKSSVASPLSRIEQETYKQRQAQIKNRVSLMSSVSADSVSTTGRLLDKLKLADSEWDDASEISINSNSNTTVDSLIRDYTILEDDIEDDEETTEKPRANFKYLKSILGSTKKKQSQKSAVTKALEMGKRINTVEQNASRVINRSDVRSIHLDNLIHDANSSIISLYETDEESEEEDEEDAEDDVKEEYDNSDRNEYEHDNFINKPDSLYDTSSLNKLIPIKTQTDDDEFSFVPQTPTKSVMELTPINSPQLHSRLASPSNSISITPKRNIYQHKYTSSNLSNLSNVSHNSGLIDEISESFITKKPTEDIVFNPNISKRQITHSHTHSAATHEVQTSKSSDLQDISFLNRSVSVPIRRPTKQSPVPSQILPPTPPSSQGSIKKLSLGSQNSLKKPSSSSSSSEFQNIPILSRNNSINLNNNNTTAKTNPSNNYNTNFNNNPNNNANNNTTNNATNNYNTLDGNNNTKYYPVYQNTISRQQQHPTQQYSQQYPPSYVQNYPHPHQFKYSQQNSQQNHQHPMISTTTPTFQPHPNQQQQSNPYYNNSPSSKYRNYNQQSQPPNFFNRQPNFQQTQSNLQGYQQSNQLVNQHHYPKSTKPYYKNTRYGFSPQTSPQLGYDKLAHHSRTPSHPLPQSNPYVNQQPLHYNYYNDSGSNKLQNVILPSNTSKKNKTYQNVDLSTITPR